MKFMLSSARGDLYVLADSEIRLVESSIQPIPIPIGSSRLNGCGGSSKEGYDNRGGYVLRAYRRQRTRPAASLVGIKKGKEIS